MSKNIYIEFPQELYDKIVIRSGGRLDPADLAVGQVEDFVERNMADPSFWTEEGLALFEEDEETSDVAKFGAPDRGYQWQQLFLPNGTELRMTYGGSYHYAQVRHEKIFYEGSGKYSPSKWASKIADNTSRNAWRDIWLRLPGSAIWFLANDRRNKS